MAQTVEIVSPDYDSETYAHSAITAAHTFYLINGRVLLALNDAAANADNVFVYEADDIRGVPKAAVAVAAFDPAYWDDTNKVFTNVATGNTKCGMFRVAAASGDTGEIDLSPYA